MQVLSRFVPLHPRWFLVLGLAAIATRPHPDWVEIKQWVREEFPSVGHMTVDELEAWLANSERPRPLLLDVRTKEEFEVSHLPGAHWAPTISAALPILAGQAKGAPVVAYCSVGYRSSRLTRELNKRGFSAAVNLEGSLFEWANHGGLITAGGQPARYVHPFDKEWGRLLSRRLWPPVW